MVAKMTVLIERKRDEFMEKSFMVPLSDLKSIGSCIKLSTESQMLGLFSGSRGCQLTRGSSVIKIEETLE